MKKEQVMIVMFLSAMLSSCGIIGTIFKTGMGIGVFITIAIVVVIVIIAMKMMKKKTN